MDPRSRDEEHERFSESLQRYSSDVLCRMTLLLLATAGWLMLWLSAQTIRANGIWAISLVKSAALGVSLVAAILDYRAGTRWNNLRQQASALAVAMEPIAQEPFPVRSLRNPFTTLGFGRYVHELAVLFWSLSFFSKTVNWSRPIPHGRHAGINSRISSHPGRDSFPAPRVQPPLLELCYGVAAIYVEGIHDGSTLKSSSSGTHRSERLWNAQARA
jgi:hypothetical protein